MTEKELLEMWSTEKHSMKNDSPNPRQVLAALSTDSLVIDLDRWRTDRRLIGRKYVIFRQPDLPAKSFNAKRLVPVACATLGLLLVAPSATSVFASPNHVPGEQLPIAPKMVETDQSPIEQPKKPKREFQLEYQLKKVERKTKQFLPPKEDVQPVQPQPVETKEEDRVEPAKPVVVEDKTTDQKSPVSSRQDKPSTQSHSSPKATTTTNHSSSSAKPTTNFKPVVVPSVNQSQTAKTKSDPTTPDADEVVNGAETVDQMAVGEVSETMATPTTQDGTELPRTAGSAPTHAAAGLGVALLGLAWKTRKYGKTD
jgi:hypothetical protein